MKSIFTDKKVQPTSDYLTKALGKTSEIWKVFSDHTFKSYPNATAAWNFTGEKYGWSFRISDKKRVLIYLLPRDQFFKVAFVFGQKAFDEILKSDISESIKSELRSAPVYGEGRGIRIAIKDKGLVKDIKELIRIKIKY